jgi:hypothetical protein
LIESLLGIGIVILITEKGLSFSLSTKFITIGSQASALSIWLLLVLTLALLVDTLTTRIDPLLVSVIGVGNSATAATTRKWSSDSTKLFVLLYEVIKTRVHLNVVSVHFTIT